LKKIGERIRELRLSKGMTQKDLAAKIDLPGVYIQNISYWENGRLPSLDLIELIASGLEVTVNELLDLPGTILIEKPLTISEISTDDLINELRRRLK
jgi:transcriptional regulator with XRE-family HTH domain